MDALPSSARVVVIGGGIGGCSAAYHLARLGVTDVLLLERDGLSSGTTWHSTGNMETYRADPLIFEMVRYAAELYPQVATEAGQEIGWRNVGRVMYTDREDRWEAMQSLPELGRARGIALDLLTPDGIAQRLPIIDPSGLLGGLWIPSDARVNPTDAVMALARAARQRGVTVREHVRVLGLDVNDGAIRGVVTGTGTIACEAVVVAAGLWSGGLVESCGLRLPLHALEHQYLITKPLGLDRNMPLFLSYDDQLYGREDVGGLMVGSLDDHAIALSTAQLPQNFSFALLNERWAQFEPYMATAMLRFPALRTAEIRMLLNGPESFTPDGQMLLGPVPGLTGLYAACGFNSNGMALAPAAGRYIAEWIAEGAPSADVAPLDVRRFSSLLSADAFIRERVTEIPGYHCRIHAPDADYETARDIRHSPLHAQLAEAGARFASVNGWERPLWVADDTAPCNWLDGVAAEVRAAASAVLVVDRSADVKQLLVGPNAGAWLQGATADPASPAVTDAVLAALPGVHGEVEVLARRLGWDQSSCLLTATPEQETRLSEWLRRYGTVAATRVIDMTSSCALLELAGPGRESLLSALFEPESPAAGAVAQRATRWVGAIELRVREDRASDSTLLLMPSEGAAYVWRRLLAAGPAHGLRVGGHFAQEALRILRGIPAFGQEATPARLLCELGITPRDATEGFTQSPAPRNHATRVLAAFSSPMAVRGFGAREVVLLRDRVVGELTSRAWMPGWPATLALALLDPALWHGETLELVADGHRWPLVPRTTPWNERRGGQPGAESVHANLDSG
jgi:glycine/D-amino acid oxidase-like deaminating enzyme/glycine cleavage system aminomethyltransferase T